MRQARPLALLLAFPAGAVASLALIVLLFAFLAVPLAEVSPREPLACAGPAPRLGLCLPWPAVNGCAGAALALSAQGRTDAAAPGQG